MESILSGNLSQTILNGLFEIRKGVVVNGVETLLFDKLPETFNQIEVWRIGGKEKEFETQVSGQILDKLAMLVAGIVQNKSNGQIREGSGQLAQQCSDSVGVDGIGVGHSKQLSSSGV